MTPAPPFRSAPSVPFPPRAAAVVAWLVLLAATAGCGGDGAGRSEPPPYGEVFTSRPLLMVPDSHWEEHPEGGRWTFRGAASLLCEVRGEMEGDLTVRLLPDEATAGVPFLLRWDGEAILDAPAPLPAEGLVATVPAARLTPGRHFLEVRSRVPPPRLAVPVGFREMEATSGPIRESFTLDRSRGYRYLHELLTAGVTGLDKEGRGGFLFDGPRRERIEVALPAPGHLQLWAENASGSEAVFHVLDRGGREHRVAVAPGAGRLLRLPLPAGRSHLDFRVEGEERGLFLWGEPYLETTPAAQREAERPTPVVLVTLDTTRRDALGPYGAPPEVTPHLAEFAAGASVFEHAYSVGPWTLPSHASMFTGLYPSRHGAGVSSDYLRGHLPTLADILRRQGYFTAGFAGGHLCARRFGPGHGFLYYRDPDRFETSGDALTGYVEELLRRRGRLPLFLFVNYFDPHALYQAPPPFQERLRVARHLDALAGHPRWRAFAQGSVQAWRDILEGQATATPEVLAYLRAAYLAEVAFMDDQLGRLFDLLKRHGLYDDALILIMADHGELLGEGGYFSHAARLDPELVEVPLLIKWPGQREGRRVEALVSGVDLLPTVLATLGLPTPPLDGVALSPDGAPIAAERRYLFLEEHESRVHPLPAYMKIAPHLYGLQRLDQRQIVWQGDGSCAERAGEGWRRVDCETPGPAVLERILRALGPPETSSEGDAGALGDEAREALEALGYL